MLDNPYNESFYHIIQQWNCSLTKYRGLNNNNKKKIFKKKIYAQLCLLLCSQFFAGKST